MPAEEADGSTEWRVVTAREAALRILAPRFAGFPASATSIPLATFQRQAVEQARAIIEQRSGVIIADSVGLGKTFVALALIESAVARGQRVLVLVPACLRRMWRTELRRLRQPVTLLSHTQLGRGAVARLETPFELMVVDEAHAFRNPRTRRYRTLRALIGDAAVVLLTATPINNSLSDLYFQLRLFCADNAFRDLGIASLRALLRAESRPAELARLKHAVMVRRTRADARRALAAGAGAPAASGFRFPSRRLTYPVFYHLPHAVSEIREFLGALDFPAHRLAARRFVGAELMRLGLLKRLESSRAAGAATVRRYIHFYEEFIAALHKGLLLRPRAFRALCDYDDGALQLVLDAVSLDSASARGTASIDAASMELAVLREWHRRLGTGPDDKLDVLLSLLESRVGSKTVVFTEYRDTARYLWKALRRRLAVGLCDGSGAWLGDAPTSRRQVIERFSPRSNGCLPVHPREDIAILIATDVLAEGMNLQDADAVVSYDLPWNPVRLIQRAGRVDRMGSHHDVVHVYNFLPDREFDEFLGLVRTLRSKLEAVREVVGLDGAVLEPTDEIELVLRSIAANDADILDVAEDGRSGRLRSEFEKAAPLSPAGFVAVGALSRASGRRFVVGLIRDRTWLIAHVDGETGEEVGTGDDSLLRALGQDRCVPVDVNRVAVWAERYVRQLHLRSMLAPLARRSAAGRVAHAIRDRLAGSAAGAAPHVLAHADRVLSSLAVATDHCGEAALEQIAEQRHASLAALLRAVESALNTGRTPTRTELRWRIAAVLVAD